MIKRFILTGAPGSGKSTLLLALRERGHAVVAEAATDVIAADQARGVDEPWEQATFIDLVVTLQRSRQDAPVAAGVAVQVFDRSPLCTLALARYLDRPVSDLLADEVSRIVDEQLYQPQVFLVRPLGFIERTAARRISYPDSLVFEQEHRKVYREHGFHLINVPRGLIPDRVTTVEDHIVGPRIRPTVVNRPEPLGGPETAQPQTSPVQATRK